MANEATIQGTLRIRKTSGSLVLLDETISDSFQADVSGTKGPTPGDITVTTDGVDVDLSELTTPGLCYIKNRDANNFVTVGRWDGATSVFYPFMELKPGEGFVFRLSRSILEEFSGTGSADTGAASTLRIKAANASCTVSVQAFEA